MKRLKCNAKRDVLKLGNTKKRNRRRVAYSNIINSSQRILGMIPGEFVELVNPFNDENVLQSSILPTEELIHVM